MKIIMLGAPGAGKGTQAERISKKYGIPHISTGDIFRANIKAGTELGIKAKAYIDKGLLVPDDVTVDLVMDRLKREDCAGGYILDGFPRTIVQATALDAKEEVDAAIDVEVPDASIIRRMAGRRVCPACGEPYHTEYKIPSQDGVCDRCGAELIIRKDDEPETVKKRLTVYHDQTAPLISHYEAAGKLITVDGTESVEAVTEAIVKALEER